MTSLSCAEMSASIWAMRALIIASVSGLSVTVPLSTSLTKFLTRSLPRSFVAASRPMRPSSTILSSRLTSGENADACSLCCCASAIAASLRSELGLQLLHGAGVVERILKNLLELVVALQRPAQIGELRPELQQLLEWSDLLRHRFGREVVHALERDVDADLSAALLQLVLDGEVHPRLHVLEDGIEVVGRDLDELPILQPRQRIGRLATEIRQHAHQKRQLFRFDCAARFHVITDVHARRTDALELFLRAFSCHKELRGSRWKRRPARRQS